MQTVVLHFLPYKFFQAVFVRSIRERAVQYIAI